MFGYIIVSNKNDVVYFDGDGDFNSYLHQRLRSEILYSSDTPSTSSGVCTSSSTESLCTDEDCRSFGETHSYKYHLPLSKQEVTHLFLPIISTYRSEKAIQSEDIYAMTSDQLVILFAHLSSNYLLVSFGCSEKLQHQFMGYVELGLDLNAGPLLGLLDIDSSSVARGWNFLKSLSGKQWLHEHTKVKVHIDVRRAIFFHSKLSVTLPLLNALSLHLQDTLGSNKCLLLSNGEVLSAINSDGDENHFFVSLLVTDLNFLIKEISSSESLKSEEMFQVWLRTTKSIIPYYVDVMVSDVGNGFKIVCLFEANYNTLIRTINVFLVQLDRIQHSNDVLRETQEIEKTVESIAQQLLAFTSSSASRCSGGGYTKNPERTAYFVESLWQRTADLLLASSGCYVNDPERQRSSSNISIGSMRSALSLASLNSSTISHSTAKKFKSSLKCEITMEYFRRQAVNILLELCTESLSLNASQKLAHFRKIMSRVIDTSSGSIWSDMQMAIVTESKSAQIDDFMSPLDLGFDMVAYSVTVPAKSSSVTFTPEWVKDEFDNPMKWSSSNGSAELVGKSGKRFSLLKMRRQRKPVTTWSSVFKNLRTYVNRSNNIEEGEYAYAVALFEEGINNKLAEMELSKLIDVVSAKIYSISPYLH